MADTTKRSAPMHRFQKEREAWKASGRQGPEPKRPTQDEIDAAASRPSKVGK